MCRAPRGSHSAAAEFRLRRLRRRSFNWRRSLRRGPYIETNSVLNFNTASSLGFNGSDGHGAWKAQGDGHYKLTFRKLLYAGTGEYAGNADLNENITIQENTMSGTFTVNFSLLNGTQLCASGHFSGERISVE